MKKYKGLWLYGMSGVGKSYLSKKLTNKIKDSILIDGDVVRKYISHDLGYSKIDRTIQIRRILGIAKIIINSNKFPIASSVYFDKKIRKLCIQNKILVIKVERKNFDQVKNEHKTYKNKLNVVGVDIFYQKLKTKKIINDVKVDCSRIIKNILILIK
jgi:adenylylsulfate kinase-like enzyme